MARTLFFSQRSPFARKVRILLGEEGLAYQPKADKPTGAVLERHERRLDAALDDLRARIVDGRAPPQFGLAHAALISALDYHALRLGRARIDARPELSHWVAPHLARRSVQLAPPPTA